MRSGAGCQWRTEFVGRKQGPVKRQKQKARPCARLVAQTSRPALFDAKDGQEGAGTASPKEFRVLRRGGAGGRFRQDCGHAVNASDAGDQINTQITNPMPIKRVESGRRDSRSADSRRCRARVFQAYCAIDKARRKPSALKPAASRSRRRQGITRRGRQVGQVSGKLSSPQHKDAMIP